ncbi:putative ABC transport system ATP-binding protein [Cetobacterium ceti]|uniref:Putative ABC transport system ATP-binding protein n=1 Tax=Cetobacterium ceti TaxID=180163 RepID=A0A1T4P732_9FUSO|nr:ATP-binding cassette domain-containing protein [Cetobacterium ceti]SJZ86718.1 putative ABC transport system ATP-binding protein [Cetobacterium ceti]
MSPLTYVIKMKNISLGFKEHILLENFNLEVKKGEKIIISTPSGSGKTTLLKLIMGLKKPISGEIYINNILLNENNIDNLRQNIGYLSQKMSFRNLNIFSLIKEILSYKNNSHIKFNLEKIENILLFLNLNTDILSKEINSLSGGEKQRIGFLIALILDKDIWIFDEITSSLDMDLKEKIISYIGDTDKTVIMVTHDKVPSLNKFKEIRL